MTKIFKSKFSDMFVRITDEGWTDLAQEESNDAISLGKYPNARWELIEKALEYVKKIKGEKLK